MDEEKTALYHTLAIISVWVLLIIIFLAWNLRQKRQTTEALAIKEARSHLNKDMAYRFWATRHGGVYVPADGKTPPNPHLKHVKERDIATPSGKKLTLMSQPFQGSSFHWACQLH